MYEVLVRFSNLFGITTILLLAYYAGTSRNCKKSIFISVIISSVLYILTSFAGIIIK